MTVGTEADKKNYPKSVRSNVEICFREMLPPPTIKKGKELPNLSALLPFPRIVPGLQSLERALGPVVDIPKN